MVQRSERRIGMELLSMSAWQGGGAKSGEDVAAVGDEEVAIARVVQPLVGGERAAAQLAMIAEPRLRIIRVRSGDEAGIRQERVRGPLPDAFAPREARVARGELPFGGTRQAPAGPPA